MPQQYLSTDPNAGDPVQAPQQGGGLLDMAASALPTVGGLVGGLAGGIGGATVGGMAGQGYGELLKHASEIPGALADVARNVVTQPRATLQGFLTGANEGMVNAGVKGASEGAGQAVGGVIGKGVAGTGKLVYKGGVKLLPRTIKKEFPRMGEAGFRDSIPLTERGAVKAGKLVEKRAAATDQKLSLMDKAGAKPVHVSEALKPLQGVRDDIGDEARRAAKLAEVDTFADDVLRENPDPMSLVRTNRMKVAEQRGAAKGFRKVEKGGDVNELDLQNRMALAGGLKDALEQRVPSIAGMNKLTQDAIGLEAGADYAANTGHILSRLGGGIGGGLLGGIGGGMFPAIGAALGGAALTTPGGATSTGLLLKGAAPYTEHVSARLAALLAQLAAQQ